MGCASSKSTAAEAPTSLKATESQTALDKQDVQNTSQTALAPFPALPENIKVALRTSWIAALEEKPDAQTTDTDAPAAVRFTNVFYERLFAMRPETRPMFPNIVKQGKALVGIIAVVIRNLDDLQAIQPAVVDLGKRHQGYGVSLDMYADVKRALLNTFAVMLGDENFTTEARAAWAAAYDLLAGAMHHGYKP